MFYDNYLRVCEAKGISPTRVLQELGISKSSYAHWKNGGEPRNETKKKIADYFNLSVNQLTEGKVDEKKPLVNNDEELTEYLEELKNREEMRMLFSLTSKATKEDVEKAVKIIEALFDKQ